MLDALLLLPPILPATLPATLPPALPVALPVELLLFDLRPSRSDRLAGSWTSAIVGRGPSIGFGTLRVAISPYGYCW